MAGSRDIGDPKEPARPVSVDGGRDDAPAKPSRLWLWVVAAFLVQFAAWAAWLAIASHHKVQEVPLVQPR